MMTVEKTLMFICRGWFMYGQGDDLVGCFADAIDNVDDVSSLAKSYPKCFDMDDVIETNEIIDTEKYVVCYDADTCEQKSFEGTGLEIKEKLLKLYHKGKVEASWIFPMSKVIKTKELEKEIRSNPDSYKKVADWIDEEW